MSLRDLLVFIGVFSSLPFIMMRPFIGALVWTWLGLMNPHRLCWGAAASFPFAQLVAVVLLASLLVNTKLKKRLPATTLTGLVGFFWFWTFVTSFFAFNSWGAAHQLDKNWKIMLMAFVTLSLLSSRARIHSLIIVAAVSLGFYGVKGGIFILMTGGSYSVWGPSGTFIGGNNEIGLALIMTLPLMRYLQLQADNKRLKMFMTFSMLTTVVSIIGTYSRGALVGLIVLAGFFVMKSRNRAPMILVAAIALPLIVAFMPQSWHDRMGTINMDATTEDASAAGRVNAWWTAFYIALDHPIVGGGFGALTDSLAFQLYAPDPNNRHDAHSIYFEVLAEHGFVGLGIFLAIGLTALMMAQRVVRRTKKVPELRWMSDLASMLFVSLMGYAASGAFLGLAYFDFYYLLLMVVIALTALLDRYEQTGTTDATEQAFALPEELESKDAAQVPSRPGLGGSAGRRPGAPMPQNKRGMRLKERFQAWFLRM